MSSSTARPFVRGASFQPRRGRRSPRRSAPHCSRFFAAPRNGLPVRCHCTGMSTDLERGGRPPPPPAGARNNTTGARRNITTGANLRRRLLPLYIAAGLQGFMLWTPVEKVFLNEIGFDAAAVGLMAAAYAALIPLVEVPSGMLADRWSRRGVLMLANAALVVSVLVGGLSHSVVVYIIGALG